jgi:hypothetical protein
VSRSSALLTARDAERVLRFVDRAADVGRDEPFPKEVLVELRRLVPADGVAYCELDRVRERVRHLAVVPDQHNEVGVTYWDIAAEHPVCRRHNTGDFSALKLSDFMTRAQLHRSRVYDVWFRPSGVAYQLNVSIPSPPWHTRTFLFERGVGRDFTERDRRILQALQPHLGKLWRAARTRRRLTAAMDALEHGSEHDTRCFVLLTRTGGIEFASAPARRLFTAYFEHAHDGELPPPVDTWLRRPCARSFAGRGRAG